MNIQLIDSLIEVILSLPDEDRQLFQSRFSTKQMIKPTLVHKTTSVETVQHFQQWVSRFPKSKTNLPKESCNRESIYSEKLGNYN